MLLVFLFSGYIRMYLYMRSVAPLLQVFVLEDNRKSERPQGASRGVPTFQMAANADESFSKVFFSCVLLEIPF